MMVTLFPKAAIFAAAAIIVTSWSDMAQAATCSSIHLAGDASSFSELSSVKQCEVGGDNNDNIGGSTLDVNAHDVFGGATAPWTFLTKWSLPEDGIGAATIDSDGAYPGGGNYSGHITMVAGGSGQGGTFHITQSARTFYDQIMVVMKGPSGFNYVAFIVEDIVGLSEDGVYQSVFEKVTPLQFHDISHLSFYGRVGTVVPAPAALPLMLGALGAMAALRRRRA